MFDSAVLATLPDDVQARVADAEAALAAYGDALAKAVDFQVFGEVDFYKAAEGTDPKKARRVAGLVTTERLDRDQERVLADGLDFSECLKWGWYNDDHQKGTVVGIPEWVGYLRKGQKRPCGRDATKDGWYTDGYLINTARADSIWETAQALEGTGRTLGFSIEGKVLDRRPGVVAKALVREIAITKKPVNPDSYLDLPTLAKALEAGSDPVPHGGQPGDGGPLRRQSLQGTPVPDPNQENTTMSKKTHAEFEADRNEKKLSVEDYQKSLDKDDPEGGKLYRSMCADAEMRKSVDEKLDALAKSVESLKGELEATRRVADGKADLVNKSVRQDEHGNFDVGELIKSLVDRVEGAISTMATNVEAVVRSQIAGATLTDRLVKAVQSRDAEIADLKAELDEVKTIAKSIAESPVGRRGATDLAQAQAIARQLGAQTPDGKNDVTSIVKSLQAKQGEAMKANDRVAFERLGNLLTEIETGYVDTAIAKAVKFGFIETAK